MTVRIVIISFLIAGVFIVAFSRMRSHADYLPVPNFSEIDDVEERKKMFFSFFASIVQDLNVKIIKDRKELLKICEEWEETERLGWFRKGTLRKIAVQYKVLPETEPSENIENKDIPEILQSLLLRVDIVPAALALVQAAKESGWGTSRFAVDGHNYYGERCFTTGCGLVPENRLEGKHFEVQTFSHPKESVASYMKNINTHWAYETFRKVRSIARSKDKELSETDLVTHLRRYSERGDKYISELLLMISSNEELLGNVL